MSTAPDPSTPSTPAPAAGAAPSASGPTPGAPAPAPAASSTAASDATERLASALATADSTATRHLQSLQQVHQARLAQQTRAAASLSAQFGASDARTVRAQAAVTSSTATVARIKIAGQQLGTPAPTVTATGWALYGRVFTSVMQPAPNLTVFLVDSKKSYLRQYGFAYTDSTGYFLINYAGATGQAGTTGQAGAASQTGATGQLFIEIASKEGQPISLSTTAFQPTLGSATYQNITLSAGEMPLGDPPETVRTTAFPSQDQKK